jgi:PTH1 family peptidyl-tRNA hydrolase
MNLYLIVGLGNPGPDYMHTRHNVGFDCLDMLASDIGASLDRTRFRGYFGEGRIGTKKVLLLKPSTYMNLSGESVGEAAAFYKVPPENIILIYDDISLEVGRLRIRKKGSPGGHNGIKSVTAHLGTDVFPRVKIGIGGPQRDLVRHVLGKFQQEERDIIDRTLTAAKDAVIAMVKTGVDSAISEYNGFRAEQVSP